MRPLLIDNSAHERIKSVVDYAEANHYTIDDLKAGKIAGDLDQHTCYLDVGYRVVFSIEDQPGPVRHLSVSLNEDGKLPSVAAVEEIIKLFGFKNEMENCHLDLEDISPARQAINVREKIV